MMNRKGMTYRLYRSTFLLKMMSHCYILLFPAFIFGTAEGKSTIYDTPYPSPSYMVLDSLSNTLYLSLSTAAKVMIYSCERNEVIGEIPLSLNPAGLAIADGGKTLFAAGKSNEGILFNTSLNTLLIEE